MSNFLNLNLL